VDRKQIEENRRTLYSDVCWKDPVWQLQNRIKAPDLAKYFLLTESERDGISGTIRLNVSTTPYYLKLSDPFDPNCPILYGSKEAIQHLQVFLKKN
jgi:lysine 2,3-aminomutase